MLLKTIPMKSINNKIALTFFLLLFSSGIVIAQEIIKETVADTIKKVNTVKKQKIDGVIAKVGDYLILDSDIDKSYLEITSQGGSIKDITMSNIG
jgi:peptidyl-prolyl cis-trans isomerase SurA